MKVRLAFSVVSQLEEPILLVDEVLAVGDKAFREKCYKRIDELLADGRTLFFVSHNETDLRRFCTRGLYLDKGAAARWTRRSTRGARPLQRGLQRGLSVLTVRPPSGSWRGGMRLLVDIPRDECRPLDAVRARPCARSARSRTRCRVVIRSGRRSTRHERGFAAATLPPEAGLASRGDRRGASRSMPHRSVHASRAAGSWTARRRLRCATRRSAGRSWGGDAPRSSCRTMSCAERSADGRGRVRRSHPRRCALTMS